MAKPAFKPLADRFIFPDAAVAAGDRSALRSSIFEVEERDTGQERTLKLWRKLGGDLDKDLRELWRHEMRQVSRVMAYAGARDVIVDVLEFVEDDDEFGVLLERVGQPLDVKRQRVGKDHWLKNLSGSRPRSLFWRNMQRVVTALGIVHAQGLVHGAVDAAAIMTEGGDAPDFQLGGFEWSLSLSGDGGGMEHADLSASASRQRPASYAFAEDWRCLGRMIADCLGLIASDAGRLTQKPERDAAGFLSNGERRLLKRLLTPTRADLLDAEALSRAIDDLLVQLGRTGAVRPGSLVMSIAAGAGLADIVYTATRGAIAADEVAAQQDWVRADLQGGATVLSPRDFEPKDNLRIVTENLIYELHASRPQGTPVWDHAICHKLLPRADGLRLGPVDEHEVTQPILVARGGQDAVRRIAQLGPDALDWSSFATARTAPTGPDETYRVKNAMLIIQVIEAVVKALEAFPVEILERSRADGQPTILLRAHPGNDRDKVARKLGLATTEQAIRRLFQEGGADAETKWRLSLAQSLGASRQGDIGVAFVDATKHKGAQAYRFEADAPLTGSGPWFLRGQQDVGSEQVIARRLRILKALPTRLDLAQMLLDPWRMRRGSRETLSEEERTSKAFLDLDKPKRDALNSIWETLPSFFVVGPPGVGKTRVATEVVTRRFATERASRLLITAQGHDALDHLQTKVADAFAAAGKQDLLIVRSVTPERRASVGAETEPLALDLLNRLAKCEALGLLPAGVGDRIKALADETQRQAGVKGALTPEVRSGLGAVVHLLLDAADVVVSTLNSADVEAMVEAREQFDWVIVEEAAKATGPELLGVMMLSARRLLIGDHRQLPAFDADRMIAILEDHALVEETLGQATSLLGPLLRDGELDDITALLRAGPDVLHSAATDARGLLDPFRSFVEQDERRRSENPNHRPISATLTEQRRMDPAIAQIVSAAFYDGNLTTSEVREKAALAGNTPLVHLAPLPASPVVVVNFRHVSSPKRGEIAAPEQGGKAWHNPQEVESVIDVLRHLRAKPGEQPTLAVLAPYKAQVDRLQSRVGKALKGPLAHLSDFASVRPGGAFVGTVDSFQGNEADVVILSLVRNNPRAGRSALGFLQDRRRMNVALSRAKTQLIIVGSLDFLKEAVRGVNPGKGAHDLDFFNRILEQIALLEGDRRGDLALATLVAPGDLRGAA
jgi:hypothetical protein